MKLIYKKNRFAGIKTYLNGSSAILALTAGIISLIVSEQVLSITLALGLFSLAFLVSVAFFLAKKVQLEIEKLRNL